ncbi:MAG TPA: YicC family protein [Tepidisphaeraceae bacterium]|nr:YicC family protein [Tepidisphaeraceae bacterium]
MTGFGDAATERGGVHYAVEIRSLNNRFFKPTIKLPDNLAGLEPELETILRKRLERGSVTYVLKMRLNSAEAAYHVNTAALEAYIAQLRNVRGLDGIARIDLAGLLALPGVCSEPRDESDEIAAHGDAIRALSEQALAKLDEMRRKEGETLFHVLLYHLNVIRVELAEIQKRAPFVIDEYYKRLTLRVNQLLSKSELSVSQQDLLREVAVFAERSDIAEELQRLGTHLNTFEEACRKGEKAGRKLDFITQEMLREANTIGSKANDADVARRVVEIKGAIDRLKEQVQNVE